MLVAPKNSLKFNILEKKYKEKIVLQLKDIRREEKTEIKDNKTTNISTLSSTTTKKKTESAKKEKCLLTL